MTKDELVQRWWESDRECTSCIRCDRFVSQGTGTTFEGYPIHYLCFTSPEVASMCLERIGA